MLGGGAMIEEQSLIIKFKIMPGEKFSWVPPSERQPAKPEGESKEEEKEDDDSKKFRWDRKFEKKPGENPERK